MCVYTGVPSVSYAPSAARCCRLYACLVRTQTTSTCLAVATVKWERCVCACTCLAECLAERKLSKQNQNACYEMLTTVRNYSALVELNPSSEDADFCPSRLKAQLKHDIQNMIHIVIHINLMYLKLSRLQLVGWDYFERSGRTCSFSPQSRTRRSA